MLFLFLNCETRLGNQGLPVSLLPVTYIRTCASKRAVFFFFFTSLLKSLKKEKEKEG
jgi:hypothetical protein